MIALMTGEDKPLRQVLAFVVSIICTGLAYVFIYPLVSNLGMFALMLGASGFFIMLAFPRREQNFTKQAFMLPWLSIGNFTNLPTYDFTQFLTGSLTLLFGISIVSLVQYAFFMPNLEAAFLQKEAAFFRSSEKLLWELCVCTGRRDGFLSRLWLFLRVHRTRFLAEELGLLAQKLPETFVKPELVRVFATEVRDMASAMQALHDRLHEQSRTGGQRVCIAFDARTGESPGTLRDRLLYMEELVRALLDALRMRACAEACGRAEGRVAQEMVVCCAGILKALSNTLDVLRSFPAESDSRNRF